MRWPTMRASLAATAMLASPLAGCAGLTPTAIDQRSPVAGRIAAETTTDRPYPTFADIPATPRDVRTVGQYNEVVTGVRGQGGDLSAWREANPAINVDTEGFAAQARGQVAEAGEQVSAEQRARTEAYAAEARRRAEPPPPPS